MAHKVPIEERFWTKVRKTDGCWEWVSVLNERGYGIICSSDRGKQKRLRAHRVAWEMVNGAIPGGLHVCHHCDNPKCVRPDHLFLGTSHDNNQDKINKGRIPKGDDHWMKKHPERIPRGDNSSTRRHPESYGKGSDSPFAVFTREEIQCIRDEYGTGNISQAQLATKFGVHQKTISRIVRHERYTNE